MKCNKPKPNAVAGLVASRKARATGRVVGVYDGIAAAMDTDAGRWQTVCEDHGTVISHATLRLAHSMSRVPDEWCETCAHDFHGGAAGSFADEGCVLCIAADSPSGGR